MALSIGELEATLRLKDQLTAEFSAAMGKVISRMGETEAPAKRLNTLHTELVGTLMTVASAFGVAWSISGLVNFIRQISEEAKVLQILSLQTRINVEDLQVLTAATKDYGVTGDQLARALYQLSQRIAGGDQSVASAYALMGISLDQVRDKNAFELFMMTERGLGTLRGAIQDAAATDLYGGRLGSSMVAFASGADEAIERARTLNAVTSPEGVKAAAEYADAVERMTREIKALATEALGTLQIVQENANKAVKQGGTEWGLVIAQLKDFAASSLIAGASTTNLATYLDHLNVAVRSDIDLVAASASGHRDAGAALDQHGQAAQFMATLTINATKPLLDWQKKYLDQLAEMGALTTQNTAYLGVNAQQLEAYKIAVEQAAKVEQAFLDLHRALVPIYKQEREALQTVTDAHLKLINEALIAEYEAMIKNNAAMGFTASGYFAVAGSLDVLMAAEEALRQKREMIFVQTGTLISIEEQLRQLSVVYTQSLYDEAMAHDAAAIAAGTHTEGIKEVAKAAVEMQSAFAFPSGFQLGPSGPAYTTLEDYLRDNSLLIAGSMINPMLQIQGRASGGSVSAHIPYLVGERRPEVFVPSSDGTIFPRDGPGGVTITNHITVNGSVLSNKDQLAAAVSDALMTRMRSQGVRFPTGV